MDANDRRAIEDLFERLSDVERNSPPRDRDAEALIGSAIERAPATPYYMAQTIVVQQQALEAAQRHIEDLERNDGRQNEGFFSGLFGGNRTREPARRDQRFDDRADTRQQGGPWNRQGGGFLAGAAQTAMGVAGGVLIGNMIAGAFSGNSAEAAGNDSNANDSSDTGADSDGGSDFADAGDFGGGDF